MKAGQLGTRLLFRGQPSSEESLIGFLIRLTEENNLASPERLYRLVQGSSPAYPTRNDLLKFAHLAGCAFSDLDERHYRRTFGDHYKGNFKFFDQMLSRECFLTFFYPRICPECLIAENIVKAVWDLTVVTSCHLHVIQLIDSCPSCGERLSWKRNRTCYCNCEFDLRQAPQTNPTAFDAYFSQHVSRALGLRTPKTLLRPPTEITADFWLLSLNGQFALLWLLGRVIPNHAKLKNGHGRAKLSVAATQILVATATATLKRWQLVRSGTHHGSCPQYDKQCLAKVRRFIYDEFCPADLSVLDQLFEFEFGPQSTTPVGLSELLQTQLSLSL